MKNALIVIAVLVVVFLLGRWTKNFDPVKIVQYDTLPPVVRIDTIRDPMPIGRYLFTDDSTYRMEVEGYNVQANSIEVYPRTVTQTVIQRVGVPGRPKRWGIGVSAGAALTRQGVQPYIGIGVQYNLISF